MPYRATEATRTARELRSRSLLDAARAIVARDGFGAATIKAVSADAQVSVGTVYTYFATREELLAAVFREAASIELDAVRASVATAPQTAAAQLRALIEAFARRAIRGRRLAWALLVEPVDLLIDAERLSYRRAYADTVAAIISRGVASGELPSQDARIVGPGIVGAIGEALIGPLSPLNGSAATTDQVIDSILALCLRAIGATEHQGDRP
ncbi:MAG: TetR/AcrR family transcriptional regulator [Dermatophilaceae bacterium]